MLECISVQLYRVYHDLVHIGKQEISFLQFEHLQPFKAQKNLKSVLPACLAITIAPSMSLCIWYEDVYRLVPINPRNIT